MSTRHVSYMSHIPYLLHHSCHLWSFARRRHVNEYMSRQWVHVTPMSTCRVSYITYTIQFVSPASSMSFMWYSKGDSSLRVSSHVYEYMSCQWVRVMSHTSPALFICHSCVIQKETPLFVYLLMYEYMSCLESDTLHLCHDSFMCVPWLIHVCAMTHSCVRHDSNVWVWYISASVRYGMATISSLLKSIGLFCKGAL